MKTEDRGQRTEDRGPWVAFIVAGILLLAVNLRGASGPSGGGGTGGPTNGITATQATNIANSIIASNAAVIVPLAGDVEFSFATTNAVMQTLNEVFWQQQQWATNETAVIETNGMYALNPFDQHAPGQPGSRMFRIQPPAGATSLRFKLQARALTIADVTNRLSIVSRDFATTLNASNFAINTSTFVDCVVESVIDPTKDYWLVVHTHVPSSTVSNSSFYVRDVDAVWNGVPNTNSVDIRRRFLWNDFGSVSNRPCAFTEANFYTTDRNVGVEMFSDEDFLAEERYLTVLTNGVFCSRLTVTNYAGWYWFDTGSRGNKLITIINGGNLYSTFDNDGTMTPFGYRLGTWMRRVSCSTNGLYFLRAPVRADVFVAGDSLSGGFGATNSTQTWPWLASRISGQRYVSHAVGSTLLVNYTNDFFHEIRDHAVRAATPAIWISYGYNDWGGDIPIAQFQPWYSNLVFYLERETQARIFVSPIVSYVNTANGNAETIQQFNTAVTNAVRGRNRVTLVNQSTLVSSNEIVNVHPNNNGNARWAFRAVELMGGSWPSPLDSGVTQDRLGNFSRVRITDLPGSGSVVAIDSGGSLFRTNVSGGGTTFSNLTTDVKLVGLFTGDTLSYGLDGFWHNYQPFYTVYYSLTILSNITINVGTNMEQSFAVATSNSFGVTPNGTPLPGEKFNIAVFNTNLVVDIYMTNNSYNPEAGGDQLTYLIKSKSIASFTFINRSNWNAGATNRWELDRVIDKKLTLVPGANVTLTTNADYTQVAVASSGGTATTNFDVASFNHIELTNGLVQSGGGISLDVTGAIKNRGANYLDANGDLRMLVPDGGPISLYDSNGIKVAIIGAGAVGATNNYVVFYGVDGGTMKFFINSNGVPIAMGNPTGLTNDAFRINLTNYDAALVVRSNGNAVFFKDIAISTLGSPDAVIGSYNGVTYAVGGTSSGGGNVGTILLVVTNSAGTTHSIQFTAATSIPTLLPGSPINLGSVSFPFGTPHFTNVVLVGAGQVAVASVANTNSQAVTNLSGVVHLAAASVLTIDANQAHDWTVTNRVSGVATLVFTNTSPGQVLSVFILGEAAGGTSRVITMVPKLGELIADEDDYSVAPALSTSFTLTNGNAAEISWLIRKLNGTNVVAKATRQFKF